MKNTTGNKKNVFIYLTFIFANLLQIINIFYITNHTIVKLISNLIQLSITAFATFLVYQTYKNLKKENSETRNDWLFFTFGNLSWTVGNTLYVYYESILGISAINTLTDLFYFIFYIFFIIFLFKLSNKTELPKYTTLYIIELIIISLAIVLIQWNFNYSYVANALINQFDFDLINFLLFTFFDTVIIILLFSIILRKTYFSYDFISTILLIAGSFFLIYGDFIQLAIQSSSIFSSGYTSDIGWTLAFTFFGLTALAKQNEDTIIKVISNNSRFKSIYNFFSFSYIYIWLGAMYFMLLWAFNHSNETERNFYVILISLIIGLIVLRLVFSSIENHKLQLKYKAALEQLKESNLELQELNNNLSRESQKLIIANNDLTNSEAELKKANETKNKLFSIISHDIRSPLNAMLVSTETVNLYFDKFSKEELSKSIKSIYLSTQQLSNLITNLFDWAKAQRDGIQFNPDFQNLTIETEEILKIYNENIKQKQLQITLNYNLQNEFAIAFCDKNLYETIIRNLISNAIKFSHPESEITITFSDYNDKFMQISVTDTGIGISEEDIPKLFRDDIDRKKIGNSPEKGSGLGLLLCKEFVEKHKGKIWVESHIGKGTTFNFTIPIKNIF